MYGIYKELGLRLPDDRIENTTEEERNMEEYWLEPTENEINKIRKIVEKLDSGGRGEVLIVDGNEDYEKVAIARYTLPKSVETIHNSSKVIKTDKYSHK